MVPEPLPGEVFHSWFFRLAEHHRTSATVMAEQLGLPPFTVHRYTIGDEFVDLTTGGYAVENLRDATGLRAQALAAMLLAPVGSRVVKVGWKDRTERAPWIWRTDTASVCPRCLVDPEAAWQVSWHLLPTVACPKHRIYLHGWCPDCRSPISIGTTTAYRRQCNGPFGPKGRIVGAKACRRPLAQLREIPVRRDRILQLQQELTSRLSAQVPGEDLQDRKEFWNLYELLFRLVICLGTPDMLPLATTDAEIWWAFHEFCELRDVVALTAGRNAKVIHDDLASFQPGPRLSAAAMLAIDELSHGRGLADAIRTFMNLRRYDEWADILWSVFSDMRPTFAIGQRILQIAGSKPRRSYDSPPYAKERLEDFDLPPAALLLAGEGLL
ncbi:TniQ family protein [Catenulispora subtropica]